MTEIIGSVHLHLYRNTTNRTLTWADPWGRKVSVGPQRGGSFARSVELAKLVQSGALVEVREQRGAIGPLPRSVDRVRPL